MSDGPADRRSFLKLAGVATVLTSGAAGTFVFATNDASTPVPTNGSPPSVVPQTPDPPRTAANLDELTDALSRATRGDVVSVTANAIDVGRTALVVPDGVTLTGDRTSGVGLPTLSTDVEYASMVHLKRNSRVTGLRFDGPNQGINETEGIPDGECIDASESGSVVDNCELFGFSYASVNAESDARIHHCDIHHNLGMGLGYGVVVNGGHPVIEWNRFNYNRHSIDCAGGRSMGYEARYNQFGPDSLEYVIGTHEPGGQHFAVHHNAFAPPIRPTNGFERSAIRVRGTPADVYRIENNWFLRDLEPRYDAPYIDSGQPIAQTDHGSETFENVVWNENHYGPDDPPPGIGVPNGRVGLEVESSGFSTLFE